MVLFDAMARGYTSHPPGQLRSRTSSTPVEHHFPDSVSMADVYDAANTVPNAAVGVQSSAFLKGRAKGRRESTGSAWQVSDTKPAAVVRDMASIGAWLLGCYVSEARCSPSFPAQRAASEQNIV